MPPNTGYLGELLLKREGKAMGLSTEEPRALQALRTAASMAV